VVAMNVLLAEDDRIVRITVRDALALLPDALD
jgi:hypothetical protein